MDLFLPFPTAAQRFVNCDESRRRSGFALRADFYAPAVKLVVELDGAQHLELGQAKYDAQRTRYLEQQGLKVLRFDDRQALLQTESLLEAIFQAVKNPS